MNVCAVCDGIATPYKCNVAQNYCGALKEDAASNGVPYAYAPAVEAGGIIRKDMSMAVFNDLMLWLNEVALWCSGPNGQGPGATPSTTDQIEIHANEMVTAAKVAEMVALMGKINPMNNPGYEAEKNMIITADYFNEIFNKLNHMKLSPQACPQCNTSCNVACETCNICQG